jgi:hypothetical protein
MEYICLLVFAVLLSDRAFLHCWPNFCPILLEVFNLLFLQEWACALYFRMFEFEIRWTVMEESSFTEFVVLEVTRKLYFQILKSVRSWWPRN